MNGRSWRCPDCGTEVVATTCNEFFLYCQSCDVHFKPIKRSESGIFRFPASDAGRDVIFAEETAWVAESKAWPGWMQV